MTNPQEWFEQTIRYFEERTIQHHLFHDYTDEQVRIRALGETYNNWIVRFKRRDGTFYSGVGEKVIQDVEGLVNILEVNREELYQTLDKIDALRSMSNPAFEDFDRLTRKILFAMVEQKGYEPQELVS